MLVSSGLENRETILSKTARLDIETSASFMAEAQDNDGAVKIFKFPFDAGVPLGEITVTFELTSNTTWLGLM